MNTEWALALTAGLNNNGSFDYQADNSPVSYGSVNVAKAGVGVQGMFFAGRLDTDGDLALAKTYIRARWDNQVLDQSFRCGNVTYNKGCAYGMYNVFKGFKLFGIQTLPGIGRAPGPGPIPSDDWYADYVDWLVANQTSPTALAGGYWGPLYFSSQTTNEALTSRARPAHPRADGARAARRGQVLHGRSEARQSAGNHSVTNPVTVPPGTHTVTATTEANNGSPIAGVTVTFTVISGPNVGATGSANTGANGQATFHLHGQRRSRNRPDPGVCRCDQLQHPCQELGRSRGQMRRGHGRRHQQT